MNMAPPPNADWRGTLSFSDRLANVSQIASAIAKSPGVSAAEAGQQAKTLEKSIYNDAKSLEEYNSTCGSMAEPEAEEEDAFEQPGIDNSLEHPASEHAIGKYTNVQHFRDGLFSFVYKASGPPTDGDSDYGPKGHLVALKVTTPSLMEKPHDSAREARILRNLSYPRIVPLLDVFNQAGGRLVLVFPFLPYDLHGLIQSKSASQAQIREHLRAMLEALKFIHEHGYIHRDIKPSNILLKSVSGPAYLADFGIAWSPVDVASEPRDGKITDVGTTCYRPPELLFGSRSYGCSLDLWAAGCTIAEAASTDGKTLFNSGDLGSELALIRSIFVSLGTPNSETWPEATNFPDWGKMRFTEYPSKSWLELLPTATPAAREVVQNLVKFESKERMPASEILECSYFSS